VVRFLVFLLGMLTASRPGQRDAAWYRAEESRGRREQGAPYADSREPAIGAARPRPPGSLPPWQPGSLPPWQPGSLPAWQPGAAGHASPPGPGGMGHGPSAHRRRILRWVKPAAVLVAVGLIFRRAIASVVLIALSAALHLVGVNIHLPSIRFAWPWQTISAGTTTNTDLGPWVLQKIEGISKPALGKANFNFFFTRKVSKNIGPWPCWYASTFYAVGHASATVNLNPGPAWWAPGSGHYRLQVLSRPAGGKPGRVMVTMALPRPQLPQSVHDITIDNIPSRPIDTQHSWTYPGFGCGALIRPQFTASVLYSEAQHIAFYKSNHVPQLTRPLISTAETEAAQTIRDNFVQPTVNAFGYTLDRFTIHWAAP